MNVLKFGGTSVGTAENLRHVKAIVEKRREPVVIVVSALGGLTDKLIAMAGDAARNGRPDAEGLAAVRERHRAIIDGLVAEGKRDVTSDAISKFISGLGSTYVRIAHARELRPELLAEAVSFGERMSSVLVAAIIEGAVHCNSLDFIKTEKWFGRNIADTKLTERLIKGYLKPDEHKVTVTGGFISTDRDTGEITNLGRGGSDYTAALIAAALGAHELEIWTDVDGFMTADPRIIPEARVMEKMSFVESMELCTFGAKVIYPPTIYPVFHKNIPIRILNTMNPSAPGTYISDNAGESDFPAKGVSSIGEVCLITIEGRYNENFPEVSSRSFNAMARQGISVLLVSQPSDEGNFSFAVNSLDSSKALEAMRKEFVSDEDKTGIRWITADSNMAILAVVGENIGRHKGLEARLSNMLQRTGIHVYAASHGASAMNYSFVVEKNSIRDALRIVHDALFGSKEENKTDNYDN